MHIILNGESREVADGLNIQALLRNMDVDGRRVAVERNREIVPKSCYGETALAADDRIEIIGFIGGG